MVAPSSPKLTDLPAEILGGLILAQRPRLVDIKAVRHLCRAFRAAAEHAKQAHRRVCFEHDHWVQYVAAARDGRIITGFDVTVKVWRDGACERTIPAHHDWVVGVAVLGGARFVSVSDDYTCLLYTSPSPRDATLSRMPSSA